MNYLAPKLHLRVAQKQILTPGLVQMVSVLALNHLELKDMINQEIMANPVLEELGEDGVVAENYTDEAFLKKETEKVPEGEGANPFDEFDFASFFTQYLDTGAERIASSEHEEIERPSFDKFLSSPSSLADHLTWQLSVAICSETVRRIADAIIGNLDENGYLTATLEEIAMQGDYSMVMPFLMKALLDNRARYERLAKEERRRARVAGKSPRPTASVRESRGANSSNDKPQ